MSQRRTAKIDGELQRLLGEIFLTEMRIRASARWPA